MHLQKIQEGFIHGFIRQILSFAIASWNTGRNVYCSNWEVTEWNNRRCKGKSIFASIFAKTIISEKICQNLMLWSSAFFEINLLKSQHLLIFAKIVAKSYADLVVVIRVYFHKQFSRNAKLIFRANFRENFNFPFNLSLTLVRFFSVCWNSLLIRRSA
jgi:hypothetical protein